MVFGDGIERSLGFGISGEFPFLGWVTLDLRSFGV